MEVLLYFNKIMHLEEERMVCTKRALHLTKWPLCFLDVNPVENLRGILSRAVHKNGKEYKNIRDLENSIRQEWAKIKQSAVQKYVPNMKNRMFEIIENIPIEISTQFWAQQ